MHRPGDVEQLTDVEFDTKLVPHRKCPGVSIDEVTVSEHRSDVADEYRNAFSKPTRLAIPTLITMRPLESAMSGFGSTAGIRVIEDVVVKQRGRVGEFDRGSCPNNAPVDVLGMSDAATCRNEAPMTECRTKPLPT